VKSQNEGINEGIKNDLWEIYSYLKKNELVKHADIKQIVNKSDATIERNIGAWGYIYQKFKDDENGSFWLTQKRMAELFGVESHTITYHLKEIYQSGELQIESTARKIRVVQQEGKLSEYKGNHKELLFF